MKIIFFCNFHCLNETHTRAWLFCGCTAIEETYPFVHICNDMLVHFHLFNFLLKCLLKVWALAHNYYVILMTKEIPLNGAFAGRPESEICGLEVEAKLDFQYQNTHPQSTSINKQGIYLQVDYRGLF